MTIPFESRVTDEHRVALGQLLVSFQALDESLSFYLGGVLTPHMDMDQFVFGMAAVQELPFARKVKLASSLKLTSLKGLNSQTLMQGRR
jgi:hypothetical protein